MLKEGPAGLASSGQGALSIWRTSLLLRHGNKQLGQEIHRPLGGCRTRPGAWPISAVPAHLHLAAPLLCARRAQLGPILMI